MSKNRLIAFWQSYKYRFVPWLAFNFRHRSVRRVEEGVSDKVIPDEEALRQISCMTAALVRAFSRPLGKHAAPIVGEEKYETRALNHHTDYQTGSLYLADNENFKHLVESLSTVGAFQNETYRNEKSDLTESVTTKSKNVQNGSNSQRLNPVSTNIVSEKTNKLNNLIEQLHPEPNDAMREITSHMDQREEKFQNLYNDTEYDNELDFYERSLIPPKPSTQIYFRALQIQASVLGLCTELCDSVVGGKGVRITHVSHGDTLPAGRVVCLYPGALYMPQEHSMILQSLGNPYMLRCLDGILVDGNSRFISGSIFRSCVGRDKVGPYPLADVTWMTTNLNNPLNVGQYINNQNKAHRSNVAYQELVVLECDLSLPERAYIPNIWYSPPLDTPLLSTPLRLVALITTRPIKKGEELFSDYFTVVS